MKESHMLRQEIYKAKIWKDLLLTKFNILRKPTFKEGSGLIFTFPFIYCL